MDKYIIAIVVFGFLGWIWESFFCTLCEGEWAERGFLYGPVCPIYGIGGSVGIMFYELISENMIRNLDTKDVFLLGIIGSAILEYSISYSFEKIFHARWWDYSNVPLNLNGRISVPSSLGFGFAAVALIKYIAPVYLSLYHSLAPSVSEFTAMIFVVLLTIDTTLTISALTDFQRKIDMLDESFQQHMAKSVADAMTKQNELYQTALKRIVIFHFPQKLSSVKISASEIRKNIKIPNIRYDRFHIFMKKE